MDEMWREQLYESKNHQKETKGDAAHEQPFADIERNEDTIFDAETFVENLVGPGRRG